MPNMSYCRFQNTLQDLRDCEEHVLDIGYEEAKSHIAPKRENETEEEYEERLDEARDNVLSPEEEKARDRLVEVCRSIVEAYDSEHGDS